MSKVGDDIITGLENAIQYVDGKRKGTRTHKVKVPKRVNVRSIRKKLKLTQKDFAETYGFTLAALRDWEQGRRKPERAARILLKIIEQDPVAVHRVLSVA